MADELGMDEPEGMDHELAAQIAYEDPPTAPIVPVAFLDPRFLIVLIGNVPGLQCCWKKDLACTPYPGPRLHPVRLSRIFIWLASCGTFWGTLQFLLVTYLFTFAGFRGPEREPRQLATGRMSGSREFPIHGPSGGGCSTQCPASSIPSVRAALCQIPDQNGGYIGKISGSKMPDSAGNAVLDCGPYIRFCGTEHRKDACHESNRQNSEEDCMRECNERNSGLTPSNGFSSTGSNIYAVQPEIYQSYENMDRHISPYGSGVYMDPRDDAWGDLLGDRINRTSIQGSEVIDNQRAIVVGMLSNYAELQRPAATSGLPVTIIPCDLPMDYGGLQTCVDNLDVELAVNPPKGYRATQENPRPAWAGVCEPNSDELGGGFGTCTRNGATDLCEDPFAAELKARGIPDLCQTLDRCVRENVYAPNAVLNDMYDDEGNFALSPRGYTTEPWIVPPATLDNGYALDWGGRSETGDPIPMNENSDGSVDPRLDDPEVNYTGNVSTCTVGLWYVFLWCVLPGLCICAPIPMYIWEAECCFARNRSAKNCGLPKGFCQWCACRGGEPDPDDAAQMAIYEAMESKRIYVVVPGPGQSNAVNQLQNACLFQKNHHLLFSVCCGNSMTSFDTLEKLSANFALATFTTLVYLILHMSGLVDAVNALVSTAAGFYDVTGYPTTVILAFIPLVSDNLTGDIVVNFDAFITAVTFLFIVNIEALASSPKNDAYDDDDDAKGGDGKGDDDDDDDDDDGGDGGGKLSCIVQNCVLIAGPVSILIFSIAVAVPNTWDPTPFGHFGAKACELSLCELPLDMQMWMFDTGKCVSDNPDHYDCSAWSRLHLAPPDDPPSYLGTCEVQCTSAPASMVGFSPANVGSHVGTAQVGTPQVGTPQVAASSDYVAASVGTAQVGTPMVAASTDYVAASNNYRAASPSNVGECVEVDACSSIDVIITASSSNSINGIDVGINTTASCGEGGYTVTTGQPVCSAGTAQIGGAAVFASASCAVVGAGTGTCTVTAPADGTCTATVTDPVTTCTFTAAEALGSAERDACSANFECNRLLTAYRSAQPSCSGACGCTPALAGAPARAVACPPCDVGGCNAASSDYAAASPDYAPAQVGTAQVGTAQVGTAGWCDDTQQPDGTCVAPGTATVDADCEYTEPATNRAASLNALKSNPLGKTYMACLAGDPVEELGDFCPCTCAPAQWTAAAAIDAAYDEIGQVSGSGVYATVDGQSLRIRNADPCPCMGKNDPEDWTRGSGSSHKPLDDTNPDCYTGPGTTSPPAEQNNVGVREMCPIFQNHAHAGPAPPTPREENATRGCQFDGVQCIMEIPNSAMEDGGLPGLKLASNVYEKVHDSEAWRESCNYEDAQSVCASSSRPSDDAPPAERAERRAARCCDDGPPDAEVAAHAALSPVYRAYTRCQDAEWEGLPALIAEAEAEAVLAEAAFAAAVDAGDCGGDDSCGGDGSTGVAEAESSRSRSRSRRGGGGGGGDYPEFCSCEQRSARVEANDATARLARRLDRREQPEGKLMIRSVQRPATWADEWAKAEAVCPTYTKPCTRTGPGYPECPDPDYLNKGKHRWEQNTDEISFDISAEDYDGPKPADTTACYAFDERVEDVPFLWKERYKIWMQDQRETIEGGRGFQQIGVVCGLLGVIALFTAYVLDYVAGMLLVFRPATMRFEFFGLIPPSLPGEMSAAHKNWSPPIVGVVDWASIDAIRNGGE